MCVYVSVYGGGGLVAKSCPTLVTSWTVACQVPLPSDSPGKNIGVGSLSLLQGIFPTQESNKGLLHCRGILYDLNQILYDHTVEMMNRLND